MDDGREGVKDAEKALPYKSATVMQLSYGSTFLDSQPLVYFHGCSPIMILIYQCPYYNIRPIWQSLESLPCSYPTILYIHNLPFQHVIFSMFGTIDLMFLLQVHDFLLNFQTQITIGTLFHTVLY